MRLMNFTSIILLLIVLLALLYLAIHKIIPTELYLAASCISLFTYALTVIGPDNIHELTIGKLTLKKEVKEAKETLRKIENIKKDIVAITRLEMENSYILASESALAMGGDKPAADRLESNLSKLEKLTDYKRFNKEMEEVFSFRKDS